MQIENEKKSRNPNPNPRAKGGGYSPAPPHSRPPSCGTDPRSPLRRGAGQDALPLAAGTPGRMRAGSKARRHPWRARRRRAHPPASAHAGEQAVTAPLRLLLRGRHGRRLRSVAAAASRGERRGREKESLGFRETPASPVLIPRRSRPAVGSDPTAERAPRRPGPNKAQVGERDGPAWWPARWLSGRRPGTARRGPYSVLGHLNSKIFNPFSFFQKQFQLFFEWF